LNGVVSFYQWSVLSVLYAKLSSLSVNTICFITLIMAACFLFFEELLAITTVHIHYSQF